jgi:hypothetical protein
VATGHGLAVQGERVGAVALATGTEMDEREIEELQDPETWDDETAEVLPPATEPRVVVPVSFTPEEFARVARFAREQGAKTSACIRDAVLDRVDQAEPTQSARARA